MLKNALRWFEENSDKIKSVSLGDLDFFPPDDNDSFSFGFEANNFVYQVVIWNEGYIKFINLNKSSMEEIVKDCQTDNPQKMIEYLNNFLIEVLSDNS